MELQTKKIDSPLEKWKGHIVIYDPMPMIRLATFEEAITEAMGIDPKLGKAKAYVALIPALLACVKEWHIDGFPNDLTIDNFPAAGQGMSKADIAALVNWVANRIINLIRGADPNE